MKREISHEVPKPAVGKLVTDAVESDISVEIPTVQQEFIFCHRCELEGHFQEQCKTKQKGEAGQKQSKGHRNPREVLQIWLVVTTKKRNQDMHSR